MKAVLIVEDEIFIAMEIERILEDAGHKVIGIAADENEALRAGREAELAFVDLNLRDGPTGPAIAHQLAARYGVRVVYVTANPAQIGEPAPTMLACVRKPFTDEAILAAVDAANQASSGAPIGTPAL